MELIVSKLLQAPHGFPTRAGGVSKGAWSSLNAGGSVGDSPTDVAANLTLLATAAGVDRARLYGVTQVHGERIVEAPSTPETCADALWSGRAGDAVGIKTADCIPLLIEDPVGRRVAAVHAGWRGAFAQLAARAVEALAAAGSKPKDLRAAIGPAIHPCCYEVGEELGGRFGAKFGQQVLQTREGRVSLDLPRVVQQTLLEAGVPEAQVEALPQCTSCDPRFFSHRRDKGLTGRHFSFIVCRFPPNP